MKNLHCVCWLLINANNELLIAKRSDQDDSFGGYWSIPGGTLDDGENVEEGLSREIQEELWVSMTNAHFFRSYRYSPNTSVEIEADYFIWNIDGEIILQEAELSEYRWVDIFGEEIQSYDFAFNQTEVVRDFIEFMEYMNFMKGEAL